MLYIDDATLDRWILEDLPYLDLTTQVLDIGRRKGRIEFRSRHPLTVCCTEEASRILQKLGAKPELHQESGARVPADTLLLSAEGRAASLHAAWKVYVNLLESTGGVATQVSSLLENARKVCPEIELLGTRKSCPGTRALMTKALLAGGASPHRLGLSETLLVFEQHRHFIPEGVPACEWIPMTRRRTPEKKLILETTSIEEALEFAEAGADGLQFDKTPPSTLKDFVTLLRSRYPKLLLLAAGGIKAGNITDYAATGVTALVTSSIYSAPPADISAAMF